MLNVNLVIHIVTTGLQTVHTLSVGITAPASQHGNVLYFEGSLEDENNQTAEARHGCCRRVYTLRQVVLYTALPYTCKYITQLHGAASAPAKLYQDAFPTAQRIQSVSFTKTRQLMLYREIIAVCSEDNKKRINTLCGQNVEFLCVKHGGT